MNYLIKATQTVHLEVLIDAQDADEALEKFLHEDYTGPVIADYEEPVVETVEKCK